MSSAAPPAGGSASCWNCRQPLPAGAARCLYCGQPQSAAGATSAAPGAASARLITDIPPATNVAAPSDAAPSRRSSRLAQGATAPAVAGQGAAPVASFTPPTAAPEPSLGPAFAGTPARAGRRVIAFSIDVIAVAAVVVAVWALTGSALLAAVVWAELLLVLWVLQARTGLGLGKALLGLRVAREDRPYSPGVMRALVRGAVTAAGACGLLVGAWLVEASAAWEGGPKRRSWADRAAGTVVVAVPPRAERARSERTERPLAIPSARPPARLTQVLDAAMPATSAGERIDERTDPPVLDVGSPATPSVVVADAPAPVIPEPPRIAPEPVSVLPEPTPRPDVPASAAPGAAAGAQPRAESAELGILLLQFDTGQSERIPLPAAVNFGRNPAADDPADILIRVVDPDSTTSRTHLRLENLDGTTWVTDRGSTNGSDLLDESGRATKLLPGVRTLVEDGDRVRVGDRVFTVSRLIGGTP